MKIEILVNPQAENYESFHQGLEKEIGALQGIEYSRAVVRAPETTLSVMHDVVRYVIDHPEILRVLPYIIELVHTSLERWKVPADKNKPPAVIVVDGKSLKMPASTNSEKRFMAALRPEKASQSKATPKPKSKNKRSNRKRSAKQTQKSQP